MKKKKFFKELTISRKILLAFLLAIICGSFILKLPISLKEGQSLSLLDSFFTIVSAICVTGLTVIDISQTLSQFGTTVLLFFIQIGGLGVMTFSLMFFLIIGKKMSVETREILKEERNSNSSGGIIPFIKTLLMTVFVIETIGALILTYEFSKTMDFSQALYFGFFHSISAFCNAGFTLFTDNLEQYRDNFLINITISYLIILGGLGFSVIHSFLMAGRTRKNRFNLTSKLSLMMCILLIFSGMIIFLVLEYNNPNTLGNLSFFDKLLPSFFQSVTLRTAGFNTIPLINLRHSTSFVACILMFIGASPGSTGGGIKTTTFIIAIFYIICILKRRDNIEIFGRRVDWEIMNKALAIILIAIFYVCIMTGIILTLENITVDVALFEVVSAFATVGLTRGLTPELTAISRILIMLTMFIGRLGPLTIAIAIAGNYKKVDYKYPKEDVLVG